MVATGLAAVHLTLGDFMNIVPNSEALSLRSLAHIGTIYIVTGFAH